MKTILLLVSLFTGQLGGSFSLLAESLGFGELGTTLCFRSLLSLTLFLNLNAKLLLLFFLLFDDGQVVIMLIFFFDDTRLILTICLFIVLSINSCVVLVLATTALALRFALRLLSLVNCAGK